MLRPTLILISERKEDAGLLGVISRESGCPLHVFRNLEEVPKQDFPPDPHHLFLDLDACDEPWLILEKEIPCPNQISSHTWANRFHFITDREFQSHPKLYSSPLLGNVLQRGNFDWEIVGNLYSKFLGPSLQTPEWIPGHFFSDKVPVHSISIQNLEGKPEGIAQFEKVLEDAEIKSRISQVIINSADEILLNALLDAPNEAANQGIDPKTDPTQFRWQLKDDILLFQVEDPYGSLQREKLFQKLWKVQKGVNVDEKEEGRRAGLGLATVIRSGASISLVTENGTRTVVTAAFFLSRSYIQFQKQFRNIGTFIF